MVPQTRVFCRHASFAAAAVAGVAFLVACQSSGSIPTTLARMSSPQSQANAKTTAWGIVVDDPSGKPLANIPVHLEPWERGCVRVTRHKARCPKPLPWHTKTDRHGKFVLAEVPSDDYLLVIGSDSPSDLTRPTIHDHILLTDGTQHLRVPTLPAIPCNQKNYKEWCDGVQPSPGLTPYPRPEVEKSGKYRLATIEPKRERPCDREFNRQRVAHHLPQAVIDEWLTENSREWVGARAAFRQHETFPPPAPLLTIDEVGDTGGVTCEDMVHFFPNSTYSGRAERDPRLNWVGGIWYRNGSRVGVGIMQFPLDPRSVDDSNVGPWP